MPRDESLVRDRIFAVVKVPWNLSESSVPKNRKCHRKFVIVETWYILIVDN